MFKWFRWSNFLDTHQEWHALVIGLADGITFQRTNWFDIDKLYGPAEKMMQEFHYYKGGLILGRLGIIAFIAGMVAAVLGNVL